MTAAEGRAKKIPRKVTAAYLEKAALAYLERFASSAENLRRVLKRKVDKRCRLRGEDPAEFAEMIEDVVARSQRSGLVDDARYAQARVASLRRRGGSARMIQAKLAAKGIARSLVGDALQDEDVDDFGAACALARRRKIGPFRSGERRPFREKDLAVLARAGFGFDVARRVIDAESPEDLDMD